MTRRRSSCFWRNQTGAAGAEMALMLPLLLAIMFGGFEAGHYFYTEQKIIKAVRDGARYAGRLPFSEYTCAGVVTRVADITAVTRTGTLKGVTPLIKGWSATIDQDIKVRVACNPTFTDGIFTEAGGARVVTVSATADYPSLFEALGFIDSDASVNASAQAVVMGI
jgi:Flp pilus assembly protein TadG